MKRDIQVESQLVAGKQAMHSIIIHHEELTEAKFEMFGGTKRFCLWNPEAGAAHHEGFKTAGRALAWLKTMLKKDGWPLPTNWELWQSSTGNYSAYIINGEGK